MALSGGGEQRQWGSAGPEGHFSAWSDTLGPCCLAAQHGSPPYIRRTLPESAKRSFATYLEMNEQSGGLLQENATLGCEILLRDQNEIYQRCFSGRCHGFFPPAINLQSHYLSSNYIKWNGCPIVLISVPYDLALHGNEMVFWSQWGLLLGSGGGGVGGWSRPRVSAAVIYLEFRLYSSPCCHSVPSPGSVRQHPASPLHPTVTAQWSTFHERLLKVGLNGLIFPTSCRVGGVRLSRLLCCCCCCCCRLASLYCTRHQREDGVSEITPHTSHSHPFSSFFCNFGRKKFFRITAPHCRPGWCWWPATALIRFYARPAPVKAAALELRFHIQPRPAERETAREQECSSRSFSPLYATKTTCQGETGAWRKY